MEANWLKEELRTRLCLSHKIIVHIGPCPWLVSGLLISFIHGIYCNVYTVQCNVSTDSSLFVWLSRLAKPKQNAKFEWNFQLKIIHIKPNMLINFVLVSFLSCCFCRLSTSLYGTMCNFYCVQCNVGTVCLFGYLV